MVKGKIKIQGDSKPGLMELPARPKPYEAKGLPFNHGVTSHGLTSCLSIMELPVIEIVSFRKFTTFVNFQSCIISLQFLMLFCSIQEKPKYVDEVAKNGL